MAPAQLAEYCQLDVNMMEKAHGIFPVRVPKRWLDKIPKGDNNHPLLKQVLPLQEELLNIPGYVTDPLQENHANPVPGLLHKYPGRVLLITAPSCAIHCRYCFRRHFSYEDNHPSQRGWGASLAYISNDPSIEEVILSGGDPLMLKNSPLSELLQQIDAIPHITTLRFHSRIPIVLPERLDQELLNTLKHLRSKIVMVVHSNHPLELDDEVRESLNKLMSIGIQLLNQSVLLKDVNDTTDTLVALSKRLWQCQTLPYYLHVPDKVAGTAHFDVTLKKGKSLIATMREQLPGYLVPRLVQEVAGDKSKRTVD